MCSVHRRACFAIIISHNAKFLKRIFLILLNSHFRFLHTLTMLRCQEKTPVALLGPALPLTRMRTRYLDHQFQITKIKFNQRSRVPGRDQNALRGVFSLVPRDLS